MTALIEAGNFIAQCDGDRRGAADRFVTMLERVQRNELPFRLNTAEWGGAWIQALLAGASTGARLIDLLSNRLGLGDLAILVERDAFVARTSYGRENVEIWTLDSQLRSYASA